jgi:hypothetical protein
VSVREFHAHNVIRIYALAGFGPQVHLPKIRTSYNSCCAAPKRAPPAAFAPLMYELKIDGFRSLTYIENGENLSSCHSIPKARLLPGAYP